MLNGGRMRSYECFATDITRVKNRLKSLYNSRAIASRGRELYHLSKREYWIVFYSWRR